MSSPRVKRQLHQLAAAGHVSADCAFGPLRRPNPEMRLVLALALGLVVACGDRLGDIKSETASPDEARCASCSYAVDAVVKVVAVYATSAGAIAARDEARMNAPNAPVVSRSKWRDRPADERLLLCWYDGPIGVPRGGGPAADRFVVIVGSGVDQLWAAGPRAVLSPGRELP